MVEAEGKSKCANDVAGTGLVAIAAGVAVPFAASVYFPTVTIALVAPLPTAFGLIRVALAVAVPVCGVPLVIVPVSIVAALVDVAVSLGAEISWIRVNPWTER